MLEPCAPLAFVLANCAAPEPAFETAPCEIDCRDPVRCRFQCPQLDWNLRVIEQVRTVCRDRSAHATCSERPVDFSGPSCLCERANFEIDPRSATEACEGQAIRGCHCRTEQRRDQTTENQEPSQVNLRL
jgi:hypothetical protein